MPEPMEVGIRVLRVSPSLESPLYAVVHVEIANRSAAACRVVRYRLHWAGGSAEFEPRDLVLDAGETVERSVSVWPNATGFELLMRGAEPAADMLEVAPLRNAGSGRWRRS